MEIVAMDMKLRGAYIARQLSFHGVTFNIEEAPLNDDFIKVYDDSVELVRVGLTLGLFICTWWNFRFFHIRLSECYETCFVYILIIVSISDSG